MNNYQDPLNLGLTERKMKFGLWYAQKKPFFIKIITVFLAVFGTTTILYSTYVFSAYFMFGRKSDIALIADMQDFGHDLVFSLAPNPIQFSAPQIIIGNATADFLVLAKNPNPKHWAHFSYSFQWSGGESKVYNSFILPGETKYIFALNEKPGFNPQNARLNIKTMDWRRVDNKKYPNWENYAQERLSLPTMGVKIISRADGTKLLEFTLENNTAFGYYEVPLNIMFLNGSTPLFVYKYIATGIKSGQKKTIQINLPSNITARDKIEITPDIDITRDDIYLKY